MALVHDNWYARNAGRRYPLHDGATGEADDGGTLPGDLLADVTLRWPAALGGYAFVGGAAVTPGAVTVVFLACPDPAGAAGYAPLAAVTVPRPVERDRPYRVEAMAAGVAGWVAFGAGAEREWRGRFSGPGQSLVAPRAARPYGAAPVEAVAVSGARATLTGAVRLRGEGDVEVVGATRVVDGVERRVALFRLKPGTGENLFDKYRGPCSGRPESRTCPVPAVERVGGVAPDCDGDLTLTFTGGVTTLAGAGGLVLEYPLGLAEACAGGPLPDGSGVPPGEAADGCPVGYEGSDPDRTTGPPARDPQGSSSGRPTPAPETCAALPYEEGFQDGAADWFAVQHGTWGVVLDPLASASSSSGADPDPEVLLLEGGDRLLTELGGLVLLESGDGYRYLYRSTDRTGRGVALWHACAYEDSRDLRVEAAVRFPAAVDAQHLAGVVLNWHLTGAVLTEQYLFAAVDRQTNRFRLLFWNGYGFLAVAETAAPLAFTPGAWYRVTAAVTANPGGSVDLALAVANDAELGSGGDPAVAATLTVSTGLYGPADGLHGLGTDRAEADFGRFRVTAL